MLKRTRPWSRCVFAALVAGFTHHVKAQNAEVMPRVGVAMAEDRWITLTDGSKVYQGVEISYLLGQKLFESKKFEPLLLDHEEGAPNQTQATTGERQAQIPKAWAAWANNSAPPTRQYDIRVMPVVETLFYASGHKSNRFAAGFSPNHINPYNIGKKGYRDNEYIASRAQLQDCAKPDFFDGQFEPVDPGPIRSNFGANIDEGADVLMGGYGLGYKQKKFKVSSQIRFIIDDYRYRIHREVVYKTKGKGQDVFVTGAYQGYSLGVDIQRRDTLLQALKKMLPVVIDDLIKNNLDKPADPNRIETAAQEDVVNKEMDLSPDNPNRRADQQAEAVSACFGKMPTGDMESVEGLASLYALYRYEAIFDQKFRNASSAPLASTVVSGKRIVLIDSGADYNDSKLWQHFLRTKSGGVQGFDFISWDDRPSDDNGHGTAAALLLHKLAPEPFHLVSAKVIGPYGETHSSAIYDAFRYAIKIKADAILVPWYSESRTMGAYQVGAEESAQQGIPVFVAYGGLLPENNIYVPAKPASKTYTTWGLGISRIHLEPNGAAAVEELVRWMKKNKGAK